MNPKQKLVQVVRGMMSEMETDVNRRNAYINKRYGMVYQGDIMQGLSIKSGFDRTPYNFLPRVVDVHKAQIFGRAPQIVSKYDKEDIDIFSLGVTPDQEEAAAQEKEKAKLRNARKAADAEIRNEAIKNIMADNDWDSVSERAAEIASWAGFAVFKGWVDENAKTWKISLLETPQNFARYWSNSNFREHEADVYMYQVSATAAKRQYKDKLDEYEDFTYSSPGYAWQRSPESQDLEKLTIKKCWVVDATGYFPGISSDGKGNLIECDEGDEKRLSVLIVGDCVVQVIDKEKDLPKYYVVNNLEQAGKPWGNADISDELIEVNRTMIETMSDWRTASWKITFPKLKYHGFDETGLIKPSDREAQGFPLDEGQDIVPLSFDNTLGEFPRLMQELWDSFTKLAKVSRVMLDDPTINPASNQGLMTTMKPLIDITESKQKRWGSFLTEMFTDALKGVAGFDKALDEAINQQTWKLKVQWPSILRREDATYQQMYMNRWNAGTISPESYLEAMGDDAAEEIDRIRDAVTDPVRVSMMAHSLGAIAQGTVNKWLGIPPQGFLQTKVQLRGELAPNEVGNLGHTYGLDSGPYGDAVGPQGQAGAAANANFINDGMLNGNPFDGGTANYHGPQQPANPTLTPDQNTGHQPVSQPGSGATGVSPQGAINQANQHAGR